MDKWLTWGFVHQCGQPIGGPPTGQVWTICHHSDPLCGRVSVATASAVAIVGGDSMAHIFIAGRARAPQQQQIDTYKPQTHLARMTHFKWTKKANFGLLESLRKVWLPRRPCSKSRHGPLNSNQM